MIKKILPIALFLSVLGLAAWFFAKAYRGIEQKKRVATNIQQLPNVRLLGLDSTAFVLAGQVPKQPTIVFYFDPNCEHCQNEARELVKQATQFTNVELLWLSTERLWVLRQFEAKYQLQKRVSTLKIGQISPNDADKRFGFRIVPTILIYDAEGQLAKKYVGETKIEALVKHLTL